MTYDISQGKLKFYCFLFLYNRDGCPSFPHVATPNEMSCPESVPELDSWRPPQYDCEAPRGLQFHVEMAHFVGILAVNFKFYCMNKTVKIHQNPMDTSLAVIMHEYLHKYFENIKKYKKFFHTQHEGPEHA